jgi:hypothetical protein
MTLQCMGGIEIANRKLRGQHGDREVVNASTTSRALDTCVRKFKTKHEVGLWFWMIWE